MSRHILRTRTCEPLPGIFVKHGAPAILKASALPLQIVGTILGVLQVALSVQMIIFGIRLVAASQFGLPVHPS